MKHDNTTSKSVGICTALFLPVFFAVMWFFILEAYAYTGNGDTIVHTTVSGDCYHSEGCGHLRSDIEEPLEEAIIQGLRPCEDCNPPVYTGDAIPEVEHHEHTHSGGHSSNGGSSHSAVYSLSTDYFQNMSTVGLYSTKVIVSGNLYHREECPIIHKNASKKTLIEAIIQGVNRCEYCNPPELSSKAVRFYELYEDSDEMAFFNYKVVNMSGTFHRMGCIEINGEGQTETICLAEAQYKGLKACTYCNPPTLHLGRYVFGGICIAIIVWFTHGAIVSSRQKKERAVQQTANSEVPKASANKNTDRREIIYAYRTPKGNCFHMSPACEALKNSKNVISYPLEKARTEWRKPCSLCARSERGMYLARSQKR